MKCIQCGGPLISVLERSRNLCAPCYLFPPPRAGRPPPHGPDGSPPEGAKDAPDVPEAPDPEEPDPPGIGDLDSAKGHFGQETA